MKKKTGSMLTSTDIRRITADIAADTKLREEASERISQNKALLEEHDKAVAESLRPSKQTRKAHAKPSRKIKLKSKTSPQPAPAPVIQPRAVVVQPRAPTLLVPKPSKLPKGGGSVGIVRDVLRANPGLIPPEVKKIAIQHPEASKSLREHGQYIYSILETLEERGEALKDQDGKWWPASGTTGAVTH